jgi:hypothetical protein
LKQKILMKIEKDKIIKYSLISLIPITIILIFLLVFFRDDPDFYVEDLPLSVKQILVKNGVMNENCKVDLDRLKIINIKHYIEEKRIKKDSQFLIIDFAAPHALKAFKEMYKKKFILQNVGKIDEKYDISEIIKNNLSVSLNCDSEIQSNLYKYAIAFVINPMYNPKLEYIKLNSDYIEIKSSKATKNFINREIQFPMKNENIKNIFYNNGFTDWGGNRIENIDWSYIGIDLVILSFLKDISSNNAVKLFDVMASNSDLIYRFKKESFLIELKYFYDKNQEKFVDVFSSEVKKLKKMDDSQFFDLMRKKLTTIN